MDFKKATELFADPNFDGDPVVIFEPEPGESPVPPEEDDDTGNNDNTGAHDNIGDNGNTDDDELTDSSDDGGQQPRIRYVVDDVPVYVVAEREQYYGKDGKLITESLRDYTRKTVKQKYSSLYDFLKRWDSASKKQAIIHELEESGVLFEPLAEEVGRDFDPFDLICHVAFGQPPLTRRERAENVKKGDYFTKYGEAAQRVIDGLLDKYADEGVECIENINILKLEPLNQHGTPIEIIENFGGRDKYLLAVKELEEQIYKKTA
jgi:type I restriction enzyme R subunit